MEPWADVNKDSELILDWEECVAQANQFDAGKRTYDTSVGKLICMVQRLAFECGYEVGLETKDTPYAHLLAQTQGNA